MERDFVKLDLGPALHANGFQDLTVMMMDDQRFELPGWPDVVSIREHLHEICTDYPLGFKKKN